MLAHLAAMDKAYETGEARRHTALPDLALAGVADASLRELAAWAGRIVRSASVEGEPQDKVAA
jgi:CRISPR system Cascade subunit CasC